MAERTLIQGGPVVAMTGCDAVYRDGAVAFAGDRILFAGPAADLPAEYRDGWATQRIDARDKVALPGLVNGHCHAAMNLLRGYADDMRLMQWLHEKIFPAEARLRGEDVYWGTALAAAEMLQAGITTFCDMYFFMDDAARAVDELGMRAVLSRGIIGEGKEAEVRFQEAADLHRRWHGGAGGRITMMLGPHAPYTCPPETLRMAAQLAAELDCGIHIHLAESRDEVEMIWDRYERSPIQLMVDTGIAAHHMVAAHCVHISEEDIDILAANAGGVVHNPVSNLKLACGVAPVTQMLRQGVQVGLGTDGAASTNTLNLFESVRLAAWLQKYNDNDAAAIDAYRALELATLGSARVLGLAHEIGSLEQGKKADLILVDLSGAHVTPRHDVLSLLAYSVRADDVSDVWVDGRRVVAGSRLTSADGAAIAAQAAVQAARLVQDS